MTPRDTICFPGRITPAGRADFDEAARSRFGVETVWLADTIVQLVGQADDVRSLLALHDLRRPAFGATQGIA